MKKVCLAIIDGWGHSESEKSDGNAIASTDCTNMKKLANEYGCAYVHASGEHVGLPLGQVGNSEVGHLTIGAGRVIKQDIVRINEAIATGTIAAMLGNAGVENIGRLHFVGLVSDGGVHSHWEILKALVRECEKRCREIFVHFVSDGRDTAPRCFEKFFADLEKFLARSGAAIASVGGRHFAMDRDNNAERTEAAFAAMTGKKTGEIDTRGLHSDEMVKPTLLRADGAIEHGDAVFFFNYRADRMRQLAKRFSERNEIFTLVDYESGARARAVLQRKNVEKTLAQVVSESGLGQAHVAESEKRAHVTYFLNGGREAPFPGEKHVIVQSPRVESYAHAPEMNVAGVADGVVAEIGAGTAFVVCNFAAPDMVGHTGDFAAACAAVAATDRAIGAVRDACEKSGYVLVITADHGNCEVMADERGNRVTKHTANKVPLIICDAARRVGADWSLRDVAPTVLRYLGLEKPAQMTGSSVVDF